MDVFAQHRVWQRARRLGISQLACPGRHTLSNLLCTTGRQFQDWSADYRVFSKDRWDVQRLFEPVVQGVLDLSPKDADFVTALDDTHLPKSGKKTPGVGWTRDPMGPKFRINLIRAQRFLQLSAMLPAGDQTAGAARAIPIRYDHVPPAPKPKRGAPKEEWKAYHQRQRKQNLNTHAVAVLAETRRQLDQKHNAASRQLIVATDSSYTNKTVLKNLPDRTTLIGRIRKDAKLFHLPREQDQPARGAKRKYGRLAPTPDAFRQDDATEWQDVTAFAAGTQHTFRVKTLAPVLWKKAGYDRPLRMVVIAPVSYRLRKGAKLLYRQPAYLICTDIDLPLQQVLQNYLWRWDIEVNHRDEKQIIGVGQAQVRSALSVERQPAFAVANYAMLLLSAARAFGVDAVETSLPQPKWRTDAGKRRISSSELIGQLRSELWSSALAGLETNSEHFAPAPAGDTKPSEFDLSLASAMLYAATG